MKGEIQKITTLYNEGLSQKELAEKLKLNYRKVVYIMQKHGIECRNRSEATYCKRNKNGDPFQIKRNFTEIDFFLFGLGIGLYWGEGNKANKNSIRLGNTDPTLIKVFLLFLTEILGIKKRKLKFGLQIFADHKPREVMDFWMRELKYSKKYFQKPVLTRKRGKGTYRQKSKNGVLTVYFHNHKLKKLLDLYIDKCRWASQNWKHADVAQLVEQLHGRLNCPPLK